ncbi:MAG: hypothetical protein J6X25_04390, partial [Bacteroidales bacterium]|nr:hypothetical protein [Bacteroidales bacterium]
AEFKSRGPILFPFQYVYYLFEVMLVLLIIIFGQMAFEKWFNNNKIPFGGILVALTWGLGHWLSKGSLFAGIYTAIGGFVFGFSGLYETVENPMICMLVGIGAFVTGEAVRFRLKSLGGIVGIAIGIGAFLLQGELWIWQTLAVALCAIVALIVPGYIYQRKVKDGV